MIRALTLACLLAAPATAQEMTRETCRIGWKAFNQMINENADMVDAQPDVTTEGWCRIDESNAGLNANDFGSLEWRAAGVEEAVAQKGAPLNIDARFTGIDLVQGLKIPLGEEYEGPVGKMQVNMSRDPDTRDFTIHNWYTHFGDLGALTVTASGGGIDLSSLNTMQFTSGGLRMYDLTVRLETTPALSAALLSDIPADTAQILIRAIPDESMDEPSRAAVLAFLDNAATADGALQISATSEQGMGFLQMVGGIMPLEEQGLSPETLSGAMDILMSGVVLSVEWTPGG